MEYPHINFDTFGIFCVLPQELIGEILHKVNFFDLRQLDATNTCWRYLINKKYNLWEFYYREIMSTDTTNCLAMNFLWQTEVDRAKQFSTLLNSNRSRSITAKVIDHITPCYKSYIKTIIKNKRICYKDLEQIKNRDDLSTADKLLAIKLYWLVHEKLPMLTIELIEREHIWDRLILRMNLKADLQLQPRIRLCIGTLFMAKKLILLTLCREDHAGERYYCNLALWIEGDRITLLCSHYEHWGEPHKVSEDMVQGPIKRIRDLLPMDMLVDYLPSGESKYYHLRHVEERNNAEFRVRQILHKMMSGELNWRLDQTATDVLTRVNMSPSVTDRDLKVACDRWAPEGNFNALSKHPKPAIVRCMRRLIYGLLKKEITQFTTSVKPAYCGREAFQFGKLWPNEFSVHSSHPEYWPLFIVEKAYHCCEPLSHLMLSLVLPEEEYEFDLKSKEEFSKLKIDPAAITKVSGWYKRLAK